jgi:hypothetical protein
MQRDGVDRVLLALVARGGVQVYSGPGGQARPEPDGGGSFAADFAYRLAGLLAAGYLTADPDRPVRLTMKGAQALRGH